MVPRMVTIGQGALRGRACTDERISAFLGIPYGEPPVGDLRWRAPRPAAGWTGVRDAMEFGPAPIQATAAEDARGCSLGIEGEETSEDCLRLNVWTPAPIADGTADPDAKLPVMVWFYGGGNQYGSTADGRYRGEWLAGEGVVVVSVEYRTNVFGFFAHPRIDGRGDGPDGGDAPCANFGYLDQRLALLWVRRNIAAFGGDPGNVTIFGFSSGASSVVAHLCSPMSAGLFRRAISQSGAGVGQANRKLNTLAEARTIGERFVRDVLGARDLAQARTMDAHELLMAMIEQPPLLDGPYAFTGWDLMLNCPVCVDGRFLTMNIPKSFALGRVNPCDLIAGVTAEEFIAGPPDRSPRGLAAYAEETFGERASDYLDACRADGGATGCCTTGDGTTDGMTDGIGSAGGRGIDGGVSDGRATIGCDPTYNLFAAGNAAMCDLLLANTPVRPYFYRFSRTPGGDPDGHAGHGSELPYVFGSALACEPHRYDGADWDLSRAMRRYWANFAATGNPNGMRDGERGVRDLPRWERCSPGSRDAMDFGRSGPTMVRDWLKPTELVAAEWHAAHAAD
ncbi:carboxylesterase/lipase family protein [Bifidobacterium avesanii]|nr:carboxylesterase family protein [Bifidobacterium avesanii]KAB8295580.1 carboxylesterase [Bifidobacterium avesanii]